MMSEEVQKAVEVEDEAYLREVIAEAEKLEEELLKESREKTKRITAEVVAYWHLASKQGVGLRKIMEQVETLASVSSEDVAAAEAAISGFIGAIVGEKKLKEYLKALGGEPMALMPVAMDILRVDALKKASQPGDGQTAQ